MGIIPRNVMTKVLNSNSAQTEKEIHEKPTKSQDEKKTKPNWKERLKFGSILATSFTLILYQGFLALAATIILVQIMCYKEILDIGYMINNKPRLPRFRITTWFLFLVWNYCLIGETFGEQFKVMFQKNPYLFFIFSHSRFKSFCFYLVGIILFVSSLAGKYDIKRFRLLAILHVLLLVITLPTYLLIKCLFEGLIWGVVPLIAVVLNDIFAYVCGKFFGRTPLIHLSPNKTWEGFIGGFVGTVFSILILSSLWCNFNHFICPAEYNEVSHIIGINSTCDPVSLFKPAQYIIVPGFVSLSFRPFMVDTVYIALFASLIAPFAGFFASGFKRAFNIKDFSNTIPGHGGIIDRFDCQFLMAIFVFVYISTFVKNTKFRKLYGKIMNLSYQDQEVFYDLLRLSLEERNML